MLWSILRPPCILWVFNLYVFADAIRPGSHPARLLTQQLTPHVSIYDSSLAAAQNRPFVSVENVSFLFRKRVREKEGESKRDMGNASSRDSVKSLNEIYASRRAVRVFTARRADSTLPLVWHNRDDNIRQYLTHLQSSQITLFRNMTILFDSHNYNWLMFMELMFMLPWTIF